MSQIGKVLCAHSHAGLSVSSFFRQENQETLPLNKSHATLTSGWSASPPLPAHTVCVSPWFEAGWSSCAVRGAQGKVSCSVLLGQRLQKELLAKLLLIPTGDSALTVAELRLSRKKSLLPSGADECGDKRTCLNSRILSIFNRAHLFFIL